MSRSTALLIGKDPDAGKDRRHEEKRAAEDEVLESITDSMDMNLSKLGDSGGQRSLVCYSSWHCIELNTTERLNNNNASAPGTAQEAGVVRDQRGPYF